MKKLFTVTKDMNDMSHDQLKGAVRNMEELANAMHVVMEELLNEHASDPNGFTVLTMSADHWGDGVKFYLPSIDGRTVIVPANRPDSLMRWKLQFFAKYGNLTLNIQFKDKADVQMDIREQDNEDQDGFESYIKDRKERSRSDAALYESMRNSKL